MKHLIKILIIGLFLTPLASEAAIHADAVWEFRASATASMVNGGGFNPSNATPGTDYSQQDAAEDSGTDLASADGDAVPCVVTSATHNFVDADEGNIIHITAGTGWTAGWYEVVSTSGNAATLDRACGTDGAKTNGTWYLGGALSLNSTLDDDFFEQTIAGNTIWIENGSYSLGEALTIAKAGDATNPIKVFGYNGTRGDNPTGANRPSINSGALVLTTGTYWVFKNIIFTGTGSSVLSAGGANHIVNCKATNTSETANRNAFLFGNAADGILLNSEGVSTLGRAVFITLNTQIIGNYLHDSDIGILNSTTGNNYIAFNIIESNATAAISNTGAMSLMSLFMNNTLYGAETPNGTGIEFATGSTDVRLLNNIIYGFTTGVTHVDTQSIGFDDYNDYYNNTTDVSNWTKGSNDLALDPGFTDAPNGNFTIGTNLKAAGFPGAFNGSATTGYLDIGAVQRVEPTEGGGGTCAPIPNISVCQ